MSPERHEFISKARPDRSGWFGSAERPRPPLSGFRVLSHGDPAVTPWLGFHQRLAAALPFLPPDMSESAHTELPLGYIGMSDRDPLFLGVGAALQVDLSYRVYDVSATFFPAPVRPRLDRTVPSAPLFDINLFEEALRTDSVVGESFDFSHDDEQTRISIRQKHAGRHNTPVSSFTFEAADTPYGLGYRLNVREEALTEESIGRFPEHVRALAELTERVGIALYRAHGLESQVPDTTLVIEPPADIAGFVANAEAKLSVLFRKLGINEDGTPQRYIV